MAALHLPIVSWCPWANELVCDAHFLAEPVKRVSPLCFLKIDKFSAVVRLYDFWLIAKMPDRHFDKFDRGIQRLLTKCREESFAACLIDDGILVKFIGHVSDIAR